ncbi:MAG: DNA primase [Chloroflexi bacterium]|nr:DNA primase [Chloroflexota bacterium]
MASAPVEEIKARLDLVELVSPSVPLRRSGRSLKGLCPFHTEKTPSFYVFPESGTWHCFGCGEGGDAFSFLMKRDNLEFGEALRELAARAGVALAPPGQATAAREEHERLYQALEASALYYQALLAQPVGQPGREYLARRQVSAEAQQQFGLGYAPDSSMALQHYLAQKGFSIDDQVAAGVVGRGQRGDTYDLLRGRVVFPIRDGQGRPIALAGRALADGVQPKYLNTPQTPLFDKSGCLYTLDVARPAIRQAGQAVIVEGYLDAIAAHQHGYHNVVATLGTAITEQHLALLKRGAPEILLALDPDAAGQAAALRALEVANRALGEDVVAVPTAQGRVRYQHHPAARNRLKVVVLPPGLDPDDLLHQDAARWSVLVAAALPVVDFVLSRLPARHDFASAEGKTAAAEEALAAIDLLPDPVERAHFLQKLSALLRVDETILAEKARRRTPRRQSDAPAARMPRSDTLEEYVLALIAASGRPEVIDLQASDFRHPAHRALFAALVARVDAGADSPSPGEHLADELRPAWAGVQIHEAALRKLSADQRLAERESAALDLRHRRLLGEHERVAALLQGGDSDDQGDTRASWLQRLQALREELQAIQRLKLQRGRIGSMVPRYRQASEVLGG